MECEWMCYWNYVAHLKYMTNIGHWMCVELNHSFKMYSKYLAVNWVMEFYSPLKMNKKYWALDWCGDSWWDGSKSGNGIILLPKNVQEISGIRLIWRFMMGWQLLWNGISSLRKLISKLKPSDIWGIRLVYSLNIYLSNRWVKRYLEKKKELHRSIAYNILLEHQPTYYVQWT